VGTHGFAQRVLNRSESTKWLSGRVKNGVGTRLGKTGGEGDRLGDLSQLVPPLGVCSLR
jgi:hypothetical protein